MLRFTLILPTDDAQEARRLLQDAIDDLQVVDATTNRTEAISRTAHAVETSVSLDGLAPSIGVSLALLDFQDGRDFELGVALNFTLLQDLLWVGRGRNVQVRANYWYFGVNPLALSGLFRQ